MSLVDQHLGDGRPHGSGGLVSEGKLHDVNVLELLVPEAGATYVMDRAYVDFQRLYALHQAGALFVTRAKKNFRFHRLCSCRYGSGTARATSDNA